MGYDIHLLTIGFHDSHDINFAKEVNQILNFPHSISEIDPEKFKEISQKITRQSNQTTFPGMKIQLRSIMLQSLHKKMD